MKNRVWWFLGFYFLLSLFIINQLVYVIIIWSNSELSNLYTNGFKVDPSSPRSFASASAFSMFYLPLIGIIVSISAMVASAVSQSVVLKSTTATRKGIFLVITFIIFLVGFYLTFVGQLFYNEWNNSAVKIIPDKTGVVVRAISFYKNWLSLRQLWMLFGLFFGLVIIAIIVVIKLYFLNIQWSRYILKSGEYDEAQLELVSPLPNNGKFDPNSSQTITISLDDKSWTDGFRLKRKYEYSDFNPKDKKKKKHKKVKKIFSKKKK